MQQVEWAFRVNTTYLTHQAPEKSPKSRKPTRAHGALREVRRAAKLVDTGPCALVTPRPARPIRRKNMDLVAGRELLREIEEGGDHSISSIEATWNDEA